MVPILCVVGASNSGKTTFLENLIPELTRRGYRVGTIKHDVHGFEMDKEGKDTWRHRQAGAHSIAISSPSQLASIRQMDREMPLEELVGRYFWSEDVVITEGYKRSHFPKIEVFRKAIKPAPICNKEDNLVAIISDDGIQSEVPVFPFDGVKQFVDMIEERFLKGRKKHGLLVQIDGKQIPMNDFVREIMTGGIIGMLSSLRGWESPRNIDIQIRLEND